MPFIKFRNNFHAHSAIQNNDVERTKLAPRETPRLIHRHFIEFISNIASRSNADPSNKALSKSNTNRNHKREDGPIHFLNFNFN